MIEILLALGLSLLASYVLLRVLCMILGLLLLREEIRESKEWKENFYVKRHR